MTLLRDYQETLDELQQNYNESLNERLFIFLIRHSPHFILLLSPLFYKQQKQIYSYYNSPSYLGER